MKRILYVELSNCCGCPSFGGYIKEERRYFCEQSGLRCAPSVVMLFEGCPLPLVESIKPENEDMNQDTVSISEDKL